MFTDYMTDASFFYIHLHVIETTCRVASLVAFIHVFIVQCAPVICFAVVIIVR
jgi:hypothetical protein